MLALPDDCALFESRISIALHWRCLNLVCVSRTSILYPPVRAHTRSACAIRLITVKHGKNHIRESFSRNCCRHLSRRPQRPKGIEHCDAMVTPRVLSVQSHVVHGFVGNKCAAFILQRLGCNVDAVNTVHFSNHTGYEQVAGTELDPKRLCEIFEALVYNGLSDYDAVLSGYIKSTEVAYELAKVIKMIRGTRPNTQYLCDPVLGDNGQLYVPLCVLEAYQRKLVPIADIITPNFYEFSLLLSGKHDLELSDMSSIEQGVRTLHTMGPRFIVVTSIEGLIPDHLVLIGSSKVDSDRLDSFKILIPRLSFRFTGTGDTFAALLLYFMMSENSLRIACLASVVILHEILLKTIEINGDKDCEVIKELCLIECGPLISQFSATNLKAKADELNILCESCFDKNNHIQN